MNIVVKVIDMKDIPSRQIYNLSVMSIRICNPQP